MKLKYFAFLAVLLSALGLAANERLLAFYFSDDGEISSAAFRMAILAFRTTMFILGAGILPVAMLVGPARLAKLFPRIGLLLCSLLISLALAESAVRIIIPTPFAIDESQRLFQYHPRLGHEFIPGIAGIAAIPFESKQLVAINSHGMRNPEIAMAKPPGVRRLAVLGDSFTSNLLVPSEKVFTAVLENALRGQWEVLNFGVDGYSTLQEWMLFEEKAVAFKPDAAILVFYLRNDLYDNAGYHDSPEKNHRPLGRLLPGGEFEIYNVPCPVHPQTDTIQSGLQRLRITDFHIFNLARKFSSAREYILVNSYPEVDMFDPNVPEWLAPNWLLFESILARLKASCNELDIPLYLVSAPTILQVYENEYWPKVRNNRQLADRFDPTFPSRMLAEICSRHDIPIVDLLPPLAAHARNGESLYFRIFQHWNELGNRRVAEFLADFLSNRFSSPASPLHPSTK